MLLGGGGRCEGGLDGGSEEETVLGEALVWERHGTLEEAAVLGIERVRLRQRPE